MSCLGPVLSLVLLYAGDRIVLAEKYYVTIHHSGHYCLSPGKAGDKIIYPRIERKSK